MATPEQEARKKLLALGMERRAEAETERQAKKAEREATSASLATPVAPRPKAAKAAAPPAPKVTAPPKTAQPTVVETPKFELPPDIKREVDYRQFYDASTGSSLDSVFRGLKLRGVDPKEFRRVAEAQGVDLNSIYEARGKGRTFDEIARANRDRGVIGFMPVAEREAAFRQTAEAAEKAMRGEAADTITLKKSGADTSTFGYILGGTQAELPEVSKPGEHGYSLSSLLVDSLKRDDNATKLFDLYGRQVATGATQKYVSARTDELVKRAGITASTPDGPARVAKLRRQALNEVIAYKTVGQWTPAVTLQDVEVTEGGAPPGIFGALKPNIELIGFNNQNQAIFRQESPLGVLFRAIDVPQAAVVGALEGSASRGVQTGANFLEYALDNTEGASPYLRYPAVGAGFVASVIMPDSLLAGGLAFKGTKAVARTARFQVVKKEAVGLLKTVAEARKAGDFPRAVEAEARLRRLLPTVADDLDRYDAEAAKALTLINSDKSDIFDEDMTALIGGGPGELSDLVAREAYARVWQHPSMRKDVLSAKLKARDVPLNVYAELYDTARQKERIVAAKADYVRNAPQNLGEYAQRYARGAAKDAIAGLLARAAGGANIVVPKLSAADVEAIAQIVAKQAPKFMSDKKAFLTDLDAALKADARFGGDDFKLVRQALATDKSRLSAQLERKLRPLIGKSVQEIQAPDLALFDRALTAVDQNNEARGMAAALLFEEVANRGKIRVEPLKIFDEVLPRDEAGNPLRLSPGASLYLYQVRRLMPTTPLSELIQAVTIQDQVVINAARKQKRDPFDLWRELFGDIRRGTDEDLNRLVGAPTAPPAPPTPTAPPTPAAPAKAPSISASAAKIIGAKPSIPANVTIIDVATPTDARALLDETLKRVISFAQIREGDAFGVVMGDVRIVAEPTTPGGPLRVIVKVGTAPARAITAPPKTGGGAALRLGFDEAEKLMTARVARGEPAMKGAPDIRPAQTPAAVAPAPAPVTAATPAPAPAAAAPTPAPKKLSVNALQREGGIGYNKAAALLDRVKSGELTEAQALEEARRMGGKTPAPAATVPAPAPAAVTPAPVVAVAPTPTTTQLPVLADTLEGRKEQLRAYLRANPGAQVRPLFRQFQLQPADVKAIRAEIKAERVADTERIAQLEGELEQAVQSGDEFRQGELEMEIENLRRMTVPAPSAAAVKEVVEAPVTPATAAPVTPTPTIVGPPTPAPIPTAAEAQPEVVKIVEEPKKTPAPTGLKSPDVTWAAFFRKTIKPKNPSDALRAVAKRVVDLYEDEDFAQNLATREATVRLTGKTPDEILDAPDAEREALLEALDVDGGVSEFELERYISPREMIRLTPNEALELGGFPAGTKATDLTPEILDDLTERITEIAGEVGGPEDLEPRLREMGGGSVESLADVRYDAKELQDRIVPMDKDEALAFVRKTHSKLPDPRPQGLLTSVGVAAGGDTRVVGLLNTPSAPFKDADGVVELSRVASDGKLKSGASAVTYWAMRNLQRFNRSGDPAKARLVTTSLLTERGEVYAALEPQGLRPTSLVEPSEGTGSRAGAKGTARKDEWKINWEFGPAAAPEAPHLYHIQPVYRDVVVEGKKLSVKRLNSLVQRPGTDLVAAYKDAARVLGVSSDELAMKAAETVSTASPAGRRLLAEDLRHMLLEKFNSKAVADADRKEQAKLLDKALKPEAPATVVETPAAVEAAPTSTPQVEAALISTETAPSRIQMAAKQTNVRNPELVAMAKAVQEGKATREQYEALVNRLRPITPYKQLPAPTPEAQMRTALKSNQKSKISAPRKLAEGTRVGLRVDIPALQDHGAWVVTVHNQRKSKSARSLAGSVIGYDNIAAVRNAEFVVPSENSILIASGTDNKMPYATIEGAWVPQTTEEAVARAQAAFNDPAWVQVGQDPLRHAYFYDRTTTQPIVAAEEVIQVGPLVLAKNPKYAPKEKFLYSIERDAQRVDIDRAAKKRQADIIIARLYGDDLAAEYEEIPSTFRVAAAQRLRKAEEGLAAGKITQEQFNKLVEGVSADLSDQAQIRRTRAAMADRRRGADWVRSRLLAAKSEGALDEAGVDLADWFIQQNPSIADGLAVSVRKGGELSSTAGFYETTNRVVTLFKEKGSELTATHEVLHHTERMLPDALRTAIRDEWSKRLTAAIKTATPEQRPLLTAMLTGSDRERVMKAFEAGEIPLAFYQFANPSEFWAVNASSIVAGRYAASNKGLGAKARRWLTEFIQKAKSVFGLQSDAPLIRGLDAVLKGDGTFVSKEMLSEGGVFRSVEARADSLRGYINPEQRPVAATLFSGGGLVEAGLQNVVRPGYAVEARGDIAAHYGKVFGEHIENVDVRSVDFSRLKDKDVGYLHASPVCKNFSAAKAVNAAGEQALDIETATATARAIDELKPPVFTLENVAAYLDSDALRLVEDALTRNGYTFDKNVYNAADYGGATTRKRLIIRAVREGELPPMPEKTGPADWYERVSDLVDDLPKSDVPPFMQRRLEAAGIDWQNVDRPLMVAGGSAGKNVPYAYAGGPTFTIKATPGELHRIILPGGDVRAASPRVLARITGLSDDYPLPKTKDAAVTIIGNGIPLEMTDAVIAPLIKSRAAPMPSGIPATRAVQTETPAFKAWFGGSKVVDAEGKPLVVYHGTTGDFDTFSRIGGGNAFGPGFYFTRDPAVASGYATGEGGGRIAPKGDAAPNVMPVYLKIERLFAFNNRVLSKREVADIEAAANRLRPNTFAPGALAKVFDRAYPATANNVAQFAFEQTGAAFSTLLREAGYDGLDTRLGLVVFEPTQIKSATGNVGTFSPTEPSILKQTGAAGEVKGLAETLDDGRNIIYLFQGADVSTLLHEGAHIIRKRLLDAEDMENITQWIKGRGVKVGHEFGEFIGDADEVEKAEELFAQAFEAYIKDGNAPTPRLAAAFEQLKQTMVAIYRNITSPLSGVTVTPEVRAVFDKLLAESPETSFPSLQKLLRRELLGEADEDSDFIQRLSQAAQRKGVPRTTLEDLGRQFDTAKKNGVDPAKTYISFPTPVLGKRDWSFEALAEAQQRIDEERINLIAKKRGIGMNLLARSEDDAALVEEDSPIESLRSALSVRPDETGAPAVARTVLRGIAATMFGGDVVREKGVRLMPPEMRKALDTGDRRIEESIGNTVTLLNDSLETGSPKALEAFLSGEAAVTRAGGRPIVSAGHDYMASFQRMIARAFDSLSEAERDALHEMAGILQRPDWQEELPRIGFNPDGTTFAKASVQAERQREAVASAIMKMLYRSGSGKDELGVGLSQAISRAVEATATPRPTHEFKLVELMTYIAGKTNRGSADAQKSFDGDSAEAVRAFLNGAGDLYDEASKRRLAVVIGGYGAADLAKQTLVKLNLGISEAAKTAFTNWIVGESWPAEYTEEIQRIVNRYGLNPDFVSDTILGVDYYIPRQARERMASALARVNYQPAEAAAGVDAFNNLYRYMKTRMTRGTFFLRQRYFLMNTLDHFIQMAMTAGFGPAANSVTRLIAQDLVVLPVWQQAVALLRKVPRAETISEAPLVGKAFKRDALERVRRGLQKGGDIVGNRIGQLFSAAKYRIEVNPILEGLDGGFRAGGRVYTYREIRNIAVEEGIFASFDTRQLARAVQREGSLYVNQELARWGEQSAGSLDQARRGSVITGRVRNFVSDWEETVADTAEAWGERERLGAMVALMEAGHDPRIAARLTIDALYDYSQSMTKADRSIIVGIMFPFWAFQKNANAQVFNLMFSPWGAYRMMAIRRARERSADLLTAILYGEVSGEYEVDVESMPPDLQDSYYALITEFESAYDGNPPEDAKRAMRFLLTGRGSGVEDGALYQLSPRLLQMRSEGLFSDAAKFAAYAQLRPSDASRVSYLRERAGFAVPFPRTEAVRLYYSLLGDNHAYMEVFLPESSVEAGLRHITQMAATYMVMGSFAADFFSGGALTAGGLREVKTMRVLEPVFDPERSPILGPLLADMSSDAMPPKRLAKELGTVVEGTQSVATKIHPFIGKLIDDMYGTTLLRTPADIDPFVVYEGNLQQLSPEQQERIRAIQSEYPDAGKLRDQRYYIPGGIWSMAFENTPFLGELNALLIRYDEEPLERTNIRGEILALSRGVLGVDVSMTSPAKAVKFEEPRKLRETKGL